MAKNVAAPRAPAPSDDRLVDLTRRLAAVITEHGLSEIEVESAGLKLRVQRAAIAPAPTTAAAIPTTPPAMGERPVVADAAPLTASNA